MRRWRLRGFSVVFVAYVVTNFCGVVASSPRLEIPGGLLNALAMAEDNGKNPRTKEGKPEGEEGCGDEISLGRLLDKCSANLDVTVYNGTETAKKLGRIRKDISTKIRAGDLIFQTAIDSEFDDAVAHSGAADNSVTHVGIFCPPGTVIEANDLGVVKTNICKFLENANKNIFMRLRNETLIQPSLERALSFVGRSYNPSFQPNSEGLYCSELVTESFLNPDGSRYFALYILRFDAKEFWTQYFGELGLPVPSDVLGSHPQQILEQRELLIKIIEIHSKK
jgi:hypothetical protein